MRPLTLLFGIFVFASTASSGAPPLVEDLSFRKICGAWLTIKARVERPAVEPRFDVLYLEGFADRLDNHGPLFSRLKSEGGRILSFDYPGQGESSGWGSKLYGFGTVLKLAATLEASTREDKDRPLILVGWSTGGLAAVRLIQKELLDATGRRPKGAVLLAPGLYPRMLVGERGKVTARTLTRDTSPPHQGPIRPSSPIFHPMMAAGILWNASVAREDRIPSDIPLLILGGGDDSDKYVYTEPLRNWADEQISFGAPVWFHQFPGASHELDNELASVSIDVRQMTGNFASSVVNGDLGFTFGAPRVSVQGLP